MSWDVTKFKVLGLLNALECFCRCAATEAFFLVAMGAVHCGFKDPGTFVTHLSTLVAGP